MLVGKIFGQNFVVVETNFYHISGLYIEIYIDFHLKYNNKCIQLILLIRHFGVFSFP